MKNLPTPTDLARIAASFPHWSDLTDEATMAKLAFRLWLACRKVIEGAKAGRIPEEPRTRTIRQEKFYPKLNLEDKPTGLMPIETVLRKLMPSNSVEERKLAWQDFANSHAARLEPIIGRGNQRISKAQFEAVSSMFLPWKKDRIRPIRQESGKKGGAVMHARAEARKAQAAKSHA